MDTVSHLYELQNDFEKYIVPLRPDINIRFIMTKIDKSILTFGVTIFLNSYYSTFCGVFPQRLPLFLQLNVIQPN